MGQVLQFRRPEPPRLPVRRVDPLCSIAYASLIAATVGFWAYVGWSTAAFMGGWFR